MSPSTSTLGRLSDESMRERVVSTSKGTTCTHSQNHSLEESLESSSSESFSSEISDLTSERRVSKKSTNQLALPNRAFSPQRHEFSNDDIAILIMGVTGSGKSSFISRFTDDDVKIGHSLESCKILTVVNHLY
jgi:signal recognition particle GTPase